MQAEQPTRLTYLRRFWPQVQGKPATAGMQKTVQESNSGICTTIGTGVGQKTRVPRRRQCLESKSEPAKRMACDAHLSSRSMAESRSRQPLCNGLRDIVINHHRGEQHKKHERCLINAFFYSQTDVAAHQALDEEQQDDSAIHDRDWKQIKDAEIQTDSSGQGQ